MRPLVIHYDLSHADGFDYQRLIDALRAAGAVQTTESVWFLATEQTPAQVHDSLRALMHKRDRISVHVLEIGGGYAATNLSPEAREWLARYTRRADDRKSA